MTIRIRHQSMGSNITETPLEIKKVSPYQDSSSVSKENPDNKKIIRINQSSNSESLEEKSQESDSSVMTDAERRQQRKAEYREAASIRNRALQMQKQAEEQIKQTKQFAELMQQAKEDPTILAKALNMDPSELQRKMFNKMYSIKEDPAPVKEETFEEQAKRRMDQYEQMMAQDKERIQQERYQEAERETQRIKHNYISDNILPCITEMHEFIHHNDKQSCAALVYDLMNQAYQEHCNSGKSPESFALKAQDVVDQMEEELEKRAQEQLMSAKNVSKLKKFFRDEDDEYSIRKKDFSHRRPQTLSSSMGYSAPPTLSSSNNISSSVSSRKIPLKNKSARLAQAKRNLGG